jgi:hypothetical protein
MRVMLAVLGALAFVLLGPASALALPAPMSEQQLTEQSSLVALVEIESITCIGALPDFQTKQALLSYAAKAKLLKVSKGDKKPGDIVEIDFNQIPQGMLGPWSVYYYPGEQVWTHLTVAEPRDAYISTWWNARGQLVRPAASRQLPAKPGETVSAPASEDAD